MTFMVLAGKELVDQGRTEKAMRWLGFVQGCLWMLGVPLETLKGINRTRRASAPTSSSAAST